MSNEQPLRRIGVIGDIHTESSRLEAALGFLQTAAVDRILAVGDIVTGSGDVNQCCALLRNFDVATVRGNHDRWFLTGMMWDLPEATSASDISATTYDFLRSLPQTRTFETVAGHLLLCHGLGENDMGRLLPDDTGYALEANEDLQRIIRSHEFAFVVHGHTHQRMVRTFGDVTVINAGTLSRQHEPCFLLADFGTGVVQFYDFHNNWDFVKGPAIQLSL